MVHQRWSTLFWCREVFFTPFNQGMTLGALATGTDPGRSGQLISGFFARLAHAVRAGVRALRTRLGLLSLRPRYLTLDTKDEPGLQNDFRLPRTLVGLALGPISWPSSSTSKTGAPAMYAGLTRWWGRCACVDQSFALVALGALWRRWFSTARIGRHSDR